VLNRPSSRRKNGGEQIELNLVPMMDTFVTLIGFLLYTMAFLAFVSVESPLPMSSPTEVAEKLKEKPLQLTVSLRDKDTQIWSAFDKIPSKIVPHTAVGMPDFRGIHESLLQIKQQFPAENKVVIAPSGATNYENIIGAMDAIRLFEPTDPPVFVKNKDTGVEEPVKMLFPDVVFGNILGSD
jgi:biopolymer transport protein ExbD